MGAYYQEEIIGSCDEESLYRGYHDIVERCRYDCGHSGYTGTFAEKFELEIVPGVFTLDDARGLCKDQNGKWEPASAYRLTDGTWYICGWCSA